MKLLFNITFVTLIMMLTNCDPGLSGDIKVFNHCSKNVSIKYVSNRDTVLTNVQANDYITVKILGGLGSNQKFDCCPCFANIISIAKDTQLIKKDITQQNNWNIANEQALRKKHLFKQYPVLCELHISDNDF